MRKLNAILAMVILALFVLHAVLGSFQLAGWGAVTSKWLTHGLLTLIVCHVLLSFRLTWDALRVWKKTGAPYFRQNALFWARRLSGVAIMALLAFHLTAFSYTVDGAFRLRWFDAFKLASQLLLVLAVGVHIITNVKPALIAFGVRKLKPRAADMLFVLSILLLLFAAAFIVYYIRWNGVG